MTMTAANKRPTQAVRVLKYMRDFGSITQRDATNDLGVQRLASRISELKKDGYAISRKMETVKNRYGETCAIARYFLEEEEADAENA